MSISDGQSVNAAVTNAAFVSKTVDSSMSGKLDVTNTSDATGVTDGAIHTDGGMGVEKSLHVGTTANVTGNINAGANVVVTGDVSAVNGTFTGDVDAVNSVLSGDLTAVNVNGTTVTATNLFSGTSSLGTATANSLGVDTITTTGNVVVGGDLTVSGTTTTLNSATLEVTDANIVVNNGGSDATAEGAGLTIERTGTSGSLVYEDALASKFKIGAAGSEAEVVSVSASQTLTNKTIDSDNNTITNIVNADIKAAAAIALDKLAATTASRALVSDASGFVSASSVTDTELGYVSGVTSAIQTQLNAKATDSGVVHLAGSETITGVKTLDTELVSKHIATPSNPSSGYMKIYPKSDDKFYTLTSAGVESELGSGSGGSGSKNYFPTAVASGQLTTGFNQYADAAGVSPVDGTGGSPSGQLTITSSASSPLSGANSLVITKDANNRQGEGVSIDFTLDDSDKGKVLAFSMNYAPSTNYADDYISVWFYDATNGVLLQPAPYKIKKHTLVSDKFFCEVQTPYNCSTLRMIFHCATSTTTSWTMKIDDLLYGPQAKLYGSAVTDWVSYTPTISSTSGSITNYTLTGQYKKVGDSIKVNGQLTFTGAAGTWSQMFFTLPSGLSVDETKLDSTSSKIVGKVRLGDTGVGNYYGVVRYLVSTNQLEIVSAATVTSDAGSSADPLFITGITQAAPFAWGSGDIIEFTIDDLPILGWSSSQIMSSDASTRVVAMSAFKTTTQSIATSADTVITGFDSAAIDTVGAFNATTGVYTVKVPGEYKVDVTVQYESNSTGYRSAHILKNGSIYAYGNVVTAVSGDGTGVVASTIIDCVAGATISSGAYQTSGGALNIRALSGGTQLSIQMLQGPAQIAASETVAVEYNTAAGGSIANTALTYIDFGVKESDTHGSVVGAGSGNSTTATNTWRFVAPISGRYSIDSVVTLYIPPSTAVGFLVRIYKNGIDAMAGGRVSYTSPAAGEYRGLVVSGTIRMLAGDYISIGAYQDSGASMSLETVNQANRISIIRTGNY